MGTFPFGPNGPETTGYEVTPNPTPSMPVYQPSAPILPTPPASDPYGSQAYPSAGPAYSGRGWYSSPSYAGAARHSGHVILSFLLVAALWMFWACLYPVTAFAGVATFTLVAPLLTRLLPPDPIFDIHPLPFLLAVVAAYAAITGVSRIEYWLARYPIFRIVRHVVRLALLATLTIPLIQLAGGFPTDHPALYILDVVDNPQNMALVLRTPQNIAIVLAVIVGMHFILWKAEPLRLFWHRRLAAIGLK